MPELRTQFAGLDQTANKINGLKSQLDALRSSFDSISRTLDWDVKSEQRINEDLQKVSLMLDNISRALYAHQLHVTQAKSTYTRLEDTLVQNLSALENRLYGESSSLATVLTQILGAVGTVLPQALLSALLPPPFNLIPPALLPAIAASNLSQSTFLDWLDGWTGGAEYGKNKGFENDLDYYFDNRDKDNFVYKGVGSQAERNTSDDSWLDDLEITFLKHDLFEKLEGSVFDLTEISGFQEALPFINAAGFLYGSVKGEFSVTNKGAGVDFGIKGSAFNAQIENLELFTDKLKLNAEVDILTAEAGAKAGIKYDLEKGEIGVAAQAGAMASVAKAEGSLTLDLGFLKINLGGQASVLSAGAAASAQAMYSDGKLSFGASAGAGVGLFGLEGKVGVELDYKKIVDGVATVGNAVVDVGKTVVNAAVDAFDTVVKGTLSKLKFW